MELIPPPILANILSQIGEQGFRLLGPFIAAGPTMKETVYLREVLVKADLSEFIYNGELVSETSMFKPFLMKCYEKGKITALFVESLQRLTQDGPSQDTLDMLAESSTLTLNAHFAFGMMLLCCGAVEEDSYVVEAFLEKVTDLIEGFLTVDQVELQIKSMGASGAGVFYRHFNLIQLGLICKLVHPTSFDICDHCFAFNYAVRFLNMC
ncbi:hypothetical protein ARALYDRAFT_899510 [Arabidopsis lyrata subsp. lyrata]|uniref:Uncharacterized protein n=1 Tax=Arabidopsis lyrata subsp. lyrata TaxID=81972 RepID=D7LB32_ARALL|nr:hypothetical protein ARALYDRAFT_899510 [Arabidopsis lyrata subsp. lyrata]